MIPKWLVVLRHANGRGPGIPSQLGVAMFPTFGKMDLVKALNFLEKHRLIEARGERAPFKVTVTELGSSIASEG